ncbi:MAG: oxidoreductase [Bradyrhizobium sp.]|nr:oxidoreductase [Bradyrhizobium sp.]
MVSRDIEFLFDFGSPNAYLVHRAIPGIQARTGVRVAYVPILLGGIFKATGNQSPATAFGHIRNKPDYEARDRDRFAGKHGIEGFALNPDFPINTLQLMRGAIAAERLGEFGYLDAMFDFMWRTHRKLDEPAVFREAMLDAHLPADVILMVSQQPDVKAELVANTERAVERGAFGSPTFFVGDEMWFGKERLCEVVAAASAP